MSTGTCEQLYVRNIFFQRKITNIKNYKNYKNDFESFIFWSKFLFGEDWFQVF